MVKHKMNPVNLFLVKNCSSKADIVKQGFAHLCVKKLPLFPNIMLKASDLAPKGKAAKGEKSGLMMLMC